MLVLQSPPKRLRKDLDLFLASGETKLRFSEDLDSARRLRPDRPALLGPEGGCSSASFVSVAVEADLSLGGKSVLGTGLGGRRPGGSGGGGGLAGGEASGEPSSENTPEEVEEDEDAEEEKVEETPEDEELELPLERVLELDMMLTRVVSWSSHSDSVSEPEWSRLRRHDNWKETRGMFNISAIAAASLSSNL